MSKESSKTPLPKNGSDWQVRFIILSAVIGALYVFAEPNLPNPWPKEAEYVCGVIFICLFTYYYVVEHNARQAIHRMENIFPQLFGYDLRATLKCCPECGADVTKNSEDIL